MQIVEKNRKQCGIRNNNFNRPSLLRKIKELVDSSIEIFQTEGEGLKKVGTIELSKIHAIGIPRRKERKWRNKKCFN